MNPIAKQTTITETRTVEVPAITLTLTIPQARALLAVCGHMAGCPSLSARKHTDTIYAALYSVANVRSILLHRDESPYCAQGRVDFQHELPQEEL